MVRYYSVERKVVLFFDTVLPAEAFMNTGNSMEMKFVSQVDVEGFLTEFRDTVYVRK